jgi:hypothetical protein
MRNHKELTPQEWRKKAKALRERALQTRDAQYRQELLSAAKLMDNLVTELARAHIHPE